MNLNEERSMLGSISGAWAQRRNCEGFSSRDAVIFSILQDMGLVSVVTENDDSSWAVLTLAGSGRLCSLNAKMIASDHDSISQDTDI